MVDKNHDGPHAMTQWYPYSKTENYRHCVIQFCPHYEVKDMSKRAISERIAAEVHVRQPSGDSETVDERVRFYPTEDGHYQEIKG